MNNIGIKKIIVVVLVLTIIGGLLFYLNKTNTISIPSTIDMGKSSSLLLGLVILYFILTFAILDLFFKPKTAGETAAVAGASILWAIY